ncbi:hypothetical protein Tco_0576720 [Tanacetum coccineum]
MPYLRLCIYHSLFSKAGLDKLVEETWKNSNFLESNNIIVLKKKFQALKTSIKIWCKGDKQRSHAFKTSIQSQLTELDKKFDQGKGNERLVNERSMLLQELQDLNTSASLDMAQKAKICNWIDEPSKVKKEFLNHFANRFSNPTTPRISLESQFSTKLFLDQVDELERNVSYDDFKRAVWDCSSKKSPRSDGFTFDFLHRYWNVIDQEVVDAVSEFFLSSKFLQVKFPFITLIPKTQDAKVVKHFRPISLIGLYKGIHIDESLTLSHLFYADDAVFVRKWDKSNLIYQ